jgi:hypothetical protein
MDMALMRSSYCDDAAQDPCTKRILVMLEEEEMSSRSSLALTDMDDLLQNTVRFGRTSTLMLFSLVSTDNLASSKKSILAWN